MRELDSADDRAAVLDWRLDDTGLRNAGPGPLPWIPAIPPRLANDQSWGPYLKTRSQLVSESADQVRSRARDAEPPTWTLIAPRRPPSWSPMSRCGGRRCRSAPTTADPPDPSNSKRPPAPGSNTSTPASPGRTPPPCRNGDRSSPRPDAQHASTPSCRCWPNGSPPSPAAGINAAPLLNTAINDGPATGRARCRGAVVADQPPPPTRRHRRRRSELSPHRRLGRPAGRGGRRRPGRPAPSQPVVAGAGVGGRPCPAARLAPRTTPHRHHDPTRPTTSARRWLWRISILTDPAPDQDRRTSRRRSADRHRSANRPTAPRRADRGHRHPGSAPRRRRQRPRSRRSSRTWSTRIVGLSPTWP